MDYKKILEENRDNTKLLAELVREVNSWNGSLEEYEVYEFDEDFFKTYFDSKEPIEIARATYFGSIDNWMDEYIRFNAYGNLESLSDYAYEKELQEGADDIIQYALDEADNIDLGDIIERTVEIEEEQGSPAAA